MDYEIRLNYNYVYYHKHCISKWELLMRGPFFKQNGGGCASFDGYCCAAANLLKITKSYSKVPGKTVSLHLA